MSDYAEGELIRVEMEIRLPCAATEDEVEEWINYNCGWLGGIRSANPLSRHDPECFSHAPFWNSTGQIGREEKFDIQKTENGQTYRIRYIRESV